jgi:hypothetical protein
MSGEDVNEDASYLLVIKVVPIDAGSVALLKAHFADEDVAHSKAFTGVETLAIIGKFTAQSLANVLAWFKQHEQRFAEATIEIGGEKVLIKGYSLEDVTDFLKSGVVHKLLRDLKQK